MRFWITKTGDVPIREQLVRQVILGILSEDLPPGHRLPSVRALSRLHRIHANTVSAAYHQLLERGWLEFRRGSGLYVRRASSPQDGRDDLHHLLAELLKIAQSHGHEPEHVLRRLEQMIRPCLYDRILIVEPEDAMREILHAEIREQVRFPVEAVAAVASSGGHPRESLVVALATRTGIVNQPCIPLRLRSVRGSLEGQQRPDPGAIVSIVSRSAEIRDWARAMLVAVGLDPECLCEVDTTTAGWPERLAISALVVADVIAARNVPAGLQVKVFRVIADSSIAELKQFCRE